ncbi:hypothetical protein [Streptomyces sp. B6B3]|uniref:hypothetical protein n=1 Tax=Streptomyces sp. B6B3 TaxID=3153570 RepID=UPI00325DFFFC
MTAPPFPRLELVRDALARLYRGLGGDRVRGFAVSVLPAQVAWDEDEDPAAAVRRIVRVMAEHLGLPPAPVSVRFLAMAEAAWVELAEGPGYAVDLHERFAGERRDLGAVLAHEMTHVFLHRAGLSVPDTEENEVLTDTAASYLGAGWLLLDAFREDALSTQRLGYLTPEEFGYVLAKRADAFGEDPRVWFTSPQAYEAYGRGRALAARDAGRPPLAAAGPAARAGYAARRTLALRAEAPAGGASYAFEPGAAGGPAHVTFDCPVCCGRLRLPVRGRLRARCGRCGTVLDCDT